MTKRFGIIGNPIKHSLSPVLHNYWFNKYKIDASYSIIEMTENNLEVIVKKIDNQNRIDLSARVEKYLSGELSFEEDKPKKFDKSKSNSKRKDVRKSNPKPPTLRN